jgi:hypothetical protein
MRRLSRTMSTHARHHWTPHGRSRDELGVIADRYTTTTATEAFAADPTHVRR